MCATGALADAGRVTKSCAGEAEIERALPGRGRAGRLDDGWEPLVLRPSEEGQGEVHELGPDAPESRERRRKECGSAVGELGRERDRDEEPHGTEARAGA